MKKLILCFVIMTLPLVAWDTYLGMVAGAVGDSLVLVDIEQKVHVPGLSTGQVYIDKNGNPLDASTVAFPFTAMLIENESETRSESETRTLGRYAVTQPVYVQILQFYKIVNGRQVPR
jgi:hypothetical protein